MKQKVSLDETFIVVWKRHKDFSENMSLEKDKRRMLKLEIGGVKMSDMAFAELSKTVTTLSVDKRLALIDILEQSMNEENNYDPRIDAINGIFGILTHEEANEIRSNRVHFGA